MDAKRRMEDWVDGWSDGVIDREDGRLRWEMGMVSQHRFRLWRGDADKLSPPPGSSSQNNLTTIDFCLISDTNSKSDITIHRIESRTLQLAGPKYQNAKILRFHL